MIPKEKKKQKQSPRFERFSSHLPPPTKYSPHSPFLPIHHPFLNAYGTR